VRASRPAAGRASDRAGFRPPFARHPPPPRPPPSPLITECYPLVLWRARARSTLDARWTAGGAGPENISERLRRYVTSNPASPATRRRATPTTSPTWPRSCTPCAIRARTTWSSSAGLAYSSDLSLWVALVNSIPTLASRLNGLSIANVATSSHSYDFSEAPPRLMARARAFPSPPSSPASRARGAPRTTAGARPRPGGSCPRGAARATR
jgi:hypothetical protein